MNILTDSQREKIINTLKSATDEVLLTAVSEHKAQRVNIQKMYGDVKGFVGLEAMPPDEPTDDTKLLYFRGSDEKPDAKSIAARKMLDAAATARPDKNPGKSAITKIGENAKIIIFGELKRGVQPAKTYAEHLKLLHNRGLVKYDGTEYYL